MRTTNRSYSEERGDFKRLANFISDNNEDVRMYSTWCIGRFVDWKYGLYENKTAVPDFCGRNARLWFDGFRRLAGFAISEDGAADVAIITPAGFRFLFEKMLLWVLLNWGDRGPRLSIEITAEQEMEAAVLQRHGFQQKMPFTTKAIDLSKELAVPAPLEAGFSIVDMVTHPDYRAQRILRDNAFDDRSNVPEAVLRRELLFYNHSHQGPIYHPQTDLCVMAADGRFVAGCEALIDTRNAEADIERVCTHSDFRRRGFARAVVHECLKRLQVMGLGTAYITGYTPPSIALYTAAGQGPEAINYIYEMPATG